MNTFKRRVLGPLVAVLALLLWTGVTSAQATAAPVAVAAYPPTSVVDFPPNCPDWTRLVSPGPEKGAMVCFNPEGEHMFVCDVKADGYHASALWRGSNDPGYTLLDNYHGKGKCVDANFDMPEDTTLYYYSCHGDDDIGDFDCTDYYMDVDA